MSQFDHLLCLNEGLLQGGSYGFEAIRRAEFLRLICCDHAYANPSAENGNGSALGGHAMNGPHAAPDVDASAGKRQDKLVLTVHGINTYGDWTGTLSRILSHHDPRIVTEEYSYGYFSIVAFLIPIFRRIEVILFRRELERLARKHQGKTFDIVAHSFGTFIVAMAIRSGHKERLPKIGTVILAGSVLRSAFDWSGIVDAGKVARVVNECGIDDDVLIVSQLLVLFTGMAGRIGFHGARGTTLHNRWHRGGHSLYFAGDFMWKHWLPLLTTQAGVLPINERLELKGIRPLALWLVQNFEIPKILLYVAIPLGLVQRHLDQLEVGYATQVAAHAGALIAPGRPSTLTGLRLAIESVSTRPTDTGVRALERALALLPSRLPNVELPPHLQSMRFDRQGVRCLAVLSDGVAVLDTTTWKPIARLNHDELEFGEFSPNGDRVLVVNHLRTVSLWDLKSERSNVDVELEGYPKAARFTADGRRVRILTTANGHESASVEELDAVSGKRIRESGLEPGNVSAAAFSENGRWVAIATNEADTQTGDPTDPSHVVRIWDVETEKVLMTFVTESGVTVLAFGVHDTFLAAGDQYGVTRVWSTSHHDVVYESTRNQPIRTLAFSDVRPEVDRPETMTLREMVTSTAEHRALAEGKAMYPRALLAVAAEDSSVVVVDLLAKEEVGLIVPEQAATNLAFSPRGGALLLMSDDRIDAWNPATMAASTMRTASPIAAIALGPGGRSVMALGVDGIWRAWHRDTGRRLTQITLYSVRHRPPLLRAGKFSVGAHGVAVFGTSDALGDQRLHVWEGLTGWPAGVDGTKAITDLLATSLDGRRFVSALEDGTVRVGSVNPPKSIGSRSMGRELRALAMSNDGAWVAAGDESGQLRLWEVGTDSQRSFGTKGGIVAVSFSPSRRFVAYADDEGTTTVRRVDSGDKMMEVHTTATARVLAFGEDEMLAVAAEKLRIVDVSSGRVVAEREYDGEIKDMVMGPLGQPLYYAVGNVVHVWSWDWAANLVEACKRAPLALRTEESIKFGIEVRGSDPCSAARSTRAM